MGLTIDDLAGSNGLGFLIGDTSSASLTNRFRRINDAYITYGTGRFWWCKRSHDYTTTSSPALATAGNRTLTVPTASGSAFDRPYRLGYREAGGWVDIELLEDDEWLLRSATRTADAGTPDFARLIQTASAVQIELNRPVSQAFIDRIGTVTLEYFIVPARLTTGQEPIIPDKLRPQLEILAAYDMAMAQGDGNLMTSITRKLGASLTTKYEEAVVAFRRHDLTRTGRSRTIRPHDWYAAGSVRSGSGDYGQSNT